MENTAILNEVLRQMDIAHKNDNIRKNDLQYILTRGVKVLPDLPGLIQKVREYGHWTEDNDPYGEHDFGIIQWYGKKVYLKIDYYDKSLSFGQDPSSDSCRRVLTILLAEEY